MRIMWIEDDPEISVKNYFGSKVFSEHEIESIIEHAKVDGFLFEHAYEFIDDQLERYDYIIIDIDLKNSEIKNKGKAKEIMNRFGINSKNEFLEKAGFDLYIRLMEKGFPKERIIFFSANTGSALGELGVILNEALDAVNEKDEKELKVAIANLHKKLGDDDSKKMKDAIQSKELEIFLMEKQESLSSPHLKNTYEDIEQQFRSARIEIPNRAISKNNSERLEEWFNNRLNFDDSENNEGKIDYTKNYLTLRRGILNVIESLEEKDTKLSKSFEDQIDKSRFLDGLRWLLQSHSLNPKQADKFYLTLCDYMTKPFELLKFRELKIFQNPDVNSNISEITLRENWIEKRSSMIPAKFLRNWIAHGLITGSKTPDFTAADAGFTFLLVIKSLFDKDGNGHKGELNRLFGDTNQSFKSIKSRVIKFHKSDYYTRYISEKLDLIEKIGQKKGDQKPGQKTHWKKQNFLKHFYASYLIASTNLLSNRSLENNSSRSDEEFDINLTYKLQQTSFINIAYKRLQELSE